MNTLEIADRKQSLFDIEAELVEVAEAFDQLAEGGEEQPVLDAIERYFGDKLDQRDAKIDSYIYFMRQLEARENFRMEQANAIKNLAKQDGNAYARLKERLKAFLDMAGITKIETPLHKLWIQDNPGKPQVVIDPFMDPEKAPEEFRKEVITYAYDMDAIREALERNPEALGWAHIAEKGSHLRIK